MSTISWVWSVYLDFNGANSYYLVSVGSITTWFQCRQQLVGFSAASTTTWFQYAPPPAVFGLDTRNVLGVGFRNVFL